MTQLHQVNGKEYKVVSQDSVNSHREAGRHALADALEDNNIARQVYVTKPNGSQVFLVNKYENGKLSDPVKLDGFYI